MKKLIFLILMLAGGLCYGQNISSTVIGGAKTVSLAADNTVTFYSPNSYYWSFQFVWSGANATDAKVYTQVSNDGVNFVNYPVADSVSIAAASGNVILRDATTGTTERYLRFNVVHGTNTVGTLVITGNAVKK